MIIMIFFFVWLPILLLVSPAVFLLIGLISKKKVFFYFAAIFFVLFDLPVSLLAYRTVQFQNEVAQGKMLYKIIDGQFYQEIFLSKNPNFVLAIPEKFCGEKCQANLETVKHRLKYEIVSDSDPKQILPVFSAYTTISGTMVDVYQSGDFYYDVALNAKEDTSTEAQACKVGYVCLQEIQLRKPIPEMLEHLFKSLNIIE